MLIPSRSSVAEDVASRSALRTVELLPHARCILSQLRPLHRHPKTSCRCQVDRLRLGYGVHLFQFQPSGPISSCRLTYPLKSYDYNLAWPSSLQMTSLRVFWPPTLGSQRTRSTSDQNKQPKTIGLEHITCATRLIFRRPTFRQSLSLCLVVDSSERKKPPLARLNDAGLYIWCQCYPQACRAATHFQVAKGQIIMTMLYATFESP